MTEHMRRITRRSLGALLAGAAAWLGLGAAPVADQPGRRMLLSLFGEPVGALGALCLNALPSTSPRQLTDAVLAGCGGEALSGTALRRRIAERVRDDFAEGAVVNVDGWVLSLTEARLCALSVLSQADV